MYKIVASLAQQTPMIHFQVGSENISLRASDFKPRFDKYLITLGNYFDATVLTACLSGIDKLKCNLKEKKKSLYCVRFGQFKNFRRIKIPKNTLYFGEIENMIMSDSVELIIETFDEAIKNCIIKALPLFFALENFGTRQNKGFGSFTITNTSINGNKYHFEELETIYKNIQTIDVYSFDCKGTFQNLFADIKNFYSTIKGGVNFRDNNGNKYYSKSLLLRYFRNSNPDLAWEKSMMKMYMAGENIKTITNKLFVRAVLGLSDGYKFLPKGNVRYDPDLYKGKTLNIDTERNIKSVHSAKEKIVRAPSPILFKPIRTNDNSYIVYIILREDLYKENTFDLRKQKFQFKEGDTEITELALDENFDLNKFMEEVKNQFDILNNSNLTSLVSHIKLSKVKKQNQRQL